MTASDGSPRPQTFHRSSNPKSSSYIVAAFSQTRRATRLKLVPSARGWKTRKIKTHAREDINAPAAANLVAFSDEKIFRAGPQFRGQYCCLDDEPEPIPTSNFRFGIHVYGTFGFAAQRSTVAPTFSPSACKEGEWAERWCGRNGLAHDDGQTTTRSADRNTFFWTAVA